MLKIVGPGSADTNTAVASKTSSIKHHPGRRAKPLDESVDFAEKCLIRAICAIGDDANMLIVKRGELISASYLGAVVTQHFDTGLSLELSLHRSAAESEWMIEGGVWRRNEDASGILPFVEAKVPRGALPGQIEQAVAIHLEGLLACCKPFAKAQPNALELCA